MQKRDASKGRRGRMRTRRQPGPGAGVTVSTVKTVQLKDAGSSSANISRLNLLYLIKSLLSGAR